MRPVIPPAVVEGPHNSVLHIGTLMYPVCVKLIPAWDGVLSVGSSYITVPCAAGLRVQIIHCISIGVMCC